MDLATILGIVLAIGSILGGQALEGGHMGSIMQGTAFLIVMGIIGAGQHSAILEAVLMALCVTI